MKGMEESLREEAWQVKHCFTQYSIQAMTFFSAVLVAVAWLQKTQPFVALCVLPVIALLLAVARVGTHKYGTANRIYGFLLHLDRVRGLPENGDADAAGKPGLGWEEAMRAWRVVQATTFEAIYEHGPWRRNVLKKPFRGVKKKWFEPQSLVQEGARWHSGDYLRNVLVVIHVLCGLAWTSLLMLSCQLANDVPALRFIGDPLPATGSRRAWLVFAPVAILTLAMAALIWFRIRKTDARRKLLQDGFLSINSCALMWHAVAVAHRRTMLALFGPGSRTGRFGYDGYNELLSLCALNLVTEIADEARVKNRCTEAFHAWLAKDDAEFAEFLKALEKHGKAPETQPAIALRAR